ncbi:MAG: SurA N-terminal domain-containing protein [candidate division KSB1 bacterium]|nr:SurA N-terminal domain-containing protein [candidate division KSB1 bacterium]
MAIMNRMRQNTKIILMILVFAFILTIIFSWGMGGFEGRRQKGVIAEVNGDEISAKEYYDAYQQQVEQFRQTAAGR